MDSSPSSQTQPVSRGSTITRRFASKVLSLIDKYESLSSTRNQTPPLKKPNNLAARSAFHRLGKSVLARARLFIENAADQAKSSQKFERVAPPRRRFLKFSHRRRRNHTTRNRSNGFDHDGTISSNSTIIDTDNILTTSTPPVARILPSSFFSQLASSDGQTSARSKLNPRSKWRKKKATPPSLIDRGLRMCEGRKESAFAEIKRKLMPPKASIRDLTERFQEAERACTYGGLSSMEADLPQRMISKEEKFLQTRLRSRDAYRSFGGSLRDQISGYPDGYSDFFYESLKDEVEEPTATSGATQLVCRDDMNYLNTDFQYMADGSLSNFGYFLFRLESEAETPRPESETRTLYTSTSFTIPTQLDSQEPRKIKMYRKTPPPVGFFFNPENGKFRDKSTEEQSNVEIYAAKFSRAIDIVSPKPMNAVQAAQLRGMVFRYT